MRLDIHIGLHKTASTSFQEFLYINKNELSNVGVLYPDEDINESHFELPFRILKNDWAFIEEFLKINLLLAKRKKMNSVFISSEDFETIFVDSFHAVQFENIALKLGYSAINWMCVLRNQWDYFNSLYAQLSSLKGTLNYSAAAHDVVHFGELSIGSGSNKWRFAFDYDFYIDRFLKNISGSLSTFSFESFINNGLVGMEIINIVIDCKDRERAFWESDLKFIGKSNIRSNKENVEINYLANFLGIEMSEIFYLQNKNLFAPLVKYRLDLNESAKEDLIKKFKLRFPQISQRLE